MVPYPISSSLFLSEAESFHVDRGSVGINSLFFARPDRRVQRSDKFDRTIQKSRDAETPGQQ